MSQYDGIAQILIDAYFSVWDYRAWHKKENDDLPPTLFAKVHHLRSVVQARVASTPRFSLDPDWTEFGRVQFEDHDGEETFLLRSSKGIHIEKERRQRETLLNSVPMIQSDVRILAYQFKREGLELGVAGTKFEEGKRRLIAAGPPSFVGLWSYESDDDPRGSFDQGAPDAFGDLGDMDVDLASNGEL